MRFYTRDFADVYKLSYTGNISNRTLVISSLNGFLKPASNEVSLINEIQAGQGFLFMTKYEIDVDVTNLLVIDGVDYLVKGKKVNPTSAGYTEILLERTVKS